MQVARQFDRETLLKIGRGSLIAGGGALLVYLLQWLTTLDFGLATPMVVALASILVNSVREYMKGE
jgi:hypothetical protein